LINLTVKKVYCPKCGKLQRVKSTKVGEKTSFTCLKCGHVMWEKAGLDWKYLRTEK
jgi:RNase P subunit RPR2